MSRRRSLLAIEFAALFVGLPLCFVFNVVPIPLLVGLWLTAALCLAILAVASDFERRRLWSVHGLGRWLLVALAPPVAAAPAILAATWVIDRDLVFRFVRERTGLWAAVMVLYPILSVYPQGVVYRVFVFQRYRELFPGRWSLIMASAAAFSFAHVVFENWIAPAFTLVGGVLFAWTYERTGSALAVTIQHAAFGCWIFTTGLGWYFYAGAIR